MAEEEKTKIKSVSIDQLKQKVESKKKESKAVKKASKELATENNVPVDPDEIPQGDKILACLGYVHFLCIFPLILRQDSSLCQFHGKQGLVITLFFWGLGIITRLLGYPWVSDQVLIIPWIAIALYGMVAAWKGQEKKIPLFGDLAKQLKW